uniref:Carbohydrate sulfotransferase n=1 Tax=Anopheles dirus TaxID=7168 RepID=A0A182N325_9DIPT
MGVVDTVAVRRRASSSFGIPADRANVGTVLRWVAVATVVTCVVLVLILPWPLPYEESIEQIMQERSAYLREQCQTIHTLGNFTLSSVVRTSHPQHLYYNYFHQPRLRLLWCSISKVASTSWMYQFNRWAGVPREKIDRAARELKALTRMHYPVPTRAYVEQIKQEGREEPVVRFILVRDPMDRFVSAYEDLIVRPQSDNYRNLRRFIFREVYGVDVPPVSGSPENSTAAVPVPTFSDFTEFVLRRSNVLDPHWNSYYNLCDPCFLEPTVIVKLETYDRDVAYLLRLANLTADNYDNDQGRAGDRFEGHRLNVNHHRATTSASGDTLHQSGFASPSTMRRLAELTDDQFERLYRRFELDFRLFQYDASQYFALFRED